MGLKAKPSTVAGYDPAFTVLVRQTCLYVATKLNDLRDQVIVVGGLVPTLIVNQEDVPSHAGTMDLDLGFTLALFKDAAYEKVTSRLREAGFGPAMNEKGNPSSSTWEIDIGGRVLTIDFLIEPTDPSDVPSKPKHLEADFAPTVTPGLRLAKVDKRSVLLDGETIKGERARREVEVCGAGAFVLMKALAMRGRGVAKDAYDLGYVAQFYGSGPPAVAERIRSVRDLDEAREALGYLREDFATPDSVGPRRARDFIMGGEAVSADVWGAVQRILDLLR